MVIEDPQSKPSQLVSHQQARPNVFNLADPVDRLGAVVIDLFIVLLPILMLLSAPFKKTVFQSVILDNDLDFSFAILLGFFTISVCIILYQTVFTWIFGASIGKLFLGIKVVNVWTRKKPDFLACLLRSSTWLIGVFSFGFSYLSVMSNDRRRSLHDRISETIVVSQINRGVNSPSIVESSVVKGVFGGFLAFILLVFSISLYESYEHLQSEDEIISALVGQGELCAAVGEAYREWPEKQKFNESPRLNVAMALFAAGTIAKNCLEAEVDYLFRQENVGALTYLAKAFIHADRPKLSNSYLQRVCNTSPESNHCVMSKIVESWDSSDWQGVEKLFHGLTGDVPVYVQLWALRSSIKQGDFVLSKELTKKIPDISSLKEFKIKFKAMAMSGLKKGRANDDIAELALASLSDSEKINLASWLCFHQMTKSCDGLQTTSCDLIKNYYGPEINPLESSRVAMTFLRMQTCGEKPGDNLDYSLVSKELEQLADSVKLLKTKRESGQLQLWNIITNEDFDEDIRGEASRYLIESAKSRTELDKLQMHWQVLHQDLNWQITGRQLFERLLQMKAYKLATQVAQKIKNYYEDDNYFLQKSIVAEYEQDNLTEAWAQLKSLKSNSFGGRQPASTKSFDQVERQLRQEFGGR